MADEEMKQSDGERAARKAAIKIEQGRLVRRVSGTTSLHPLLLAATTSDSTTAARELPP